MSRLALALTPLALALAASAAEPRAPGRVEVVVLGGAEAPVGAPPSAVDAEAEVHVVVDLTPSMAREGDEENAPLAAARGGAAELIRALPEGTRPTVHALGVVSGSDCPLPASASFPDQEAALGFLRSVQPRAEASLAGALEELAAQVEPPARVVAFSDLEPGCGGDLCAAVRALDEAGLSLDLVALSDRPLPACLGEGRAAPTPESVARPPERHPEFRVRAWPLEEEGGEGVAVAGFSHVGVPAGSRVVVWIDLDEPVQLGPLEVGEGETLRIEILEFPALGVREAYVRGERFAARGRVEAAP